MRGVYLENDTAINVMRRWDHHDTLHYVDPPYVEDSRTQGLSGYAHEMTDDQHRELAAALHELRGAVMVSGYASALYDQLFAGWHRIERPHVAEKPVSAPRFCGSAIRITRDLDGR